MSFKLESQGDWHKTIEWFRRMANRDQYKTLQQYGIRGVDALSNSTPRRSGLTAESWNYNIIQGKDRVGIEWYNNDIEGGAIVAILIQYGHGTGTGGYVEGRDYINPAMRPIFDQMVADVWKEVTA